MGNFFEILNLKNKKNAIESCKNDLKDDYFAITALNNNLTEFYGGFKAGLVCDRYGFDSGDIERLKEKYEDNDTHICNAASYLDSAMQAVQREITDLANEPSGSGGGRSF